MSTICIQRADEMPSVCIRCGEPADVRIVHEFTHRPPLPPGLLVGLVLCGVGLPIIIGLWMLFTEKRHASLNLPLCSEHENHMHSRKVLQWCIVPTLLVIVLLTTLFVVALGHRGAAAVTAMAGILVVWFTWVVIHLTSMRKVAMDATTVTIAGASEDFHVALLMLREKREAAWEKQLQAPPSVVPAARPVEEPQAEDNPFKDFG
jgi:hypothetical protein